MIPLLNLKISMGQVTFPHACSMIASGSKNPEEKQASGSAPRLYSRPAKYLFRCAANRKQIVGVLATLAISFDGAH